jgi:phosphatidylserine decarboxylase
MSLRTNLLQLARHPELNFLLTNRIPRALATQLVGQISAIEHPWVRDASIATWRFFDPVDLDDSARKDFRSLKDCFTRELRPGARPIEPDPNLLASPCDAVVGACGAIRGTELVQVKGSNYTLDDLLADRDLVKLYTDGQYVTLRLTSSMYHRFHAPCAGRIEQVTYISGDTWNTNPIALQRVERLFCKNERAVVRLRVAGSNDLLTLVPVASILVASMRFHFADVLLHLKHKGPNVIPCDAQVNKGEELGWFELGSTIIVFAPRGYSLHDTVQPGARIKMGQALLNMPARE